MMDVDGGSVSDATLDAGLDATDASDASDAGDGDGVASSCKYAPVNQQCNMPVGSLVNIGCTGAPPSPQGGTILDGYYELTKVDHDTDAGCYSNQTRKATLEVCGSDMVWTDRDTNNSSWTGALTWSAMNTTWSMTQVCPGAHAYSFE